MALPVSTSETSTEDRQIEVRTYFVRERNAMVARAEFSSLFVDYYLHLADWEMRVEPEVAELAKQALAAVTLYCASRPRADRVAWTVHFENPLLNIFAAGDNPTETVVVNAFTENVRRGDRCLFYSDLIVGTNPPRRSVVDFEGADLLRAVERFYEQSEQRMGRFFWHGDEDLVLVTSQPDCDFEWLASLDDAAIRELDRTQALSLLEQRHYRFECGCSNERMLKLLVPTFRQDAEALFEGEDSLRISCPRCGARHVVTREALEARAAER